MPNNPYKAYQQSGQANSTPNMPQAGSPSYTEGWALIESARRMAETIQNGGLEDIKVRNKIRDAVRLNWRLWTIFQAELTVGDALPPDDIRQNMLTLCKFVDNHSIEVLREPSPDNIIVLIDLNRNIASGLLAVPEESATSEGETIAEDTPAVEEQPAPIPSGIDQDA